MKQITLRPYQQECIDKISTLKQGAYLIQMAVGLGKTLTFSQIPRNGRMLILSHREELVNQPRKYFNCSFGVEQAAQHATDEEVVSASVQSLSRRLKRFKPDEFEIIVTDECHHAASPTYRKIYDYFKPRLHLGFTATPSRGDGIGLSQIYSDIIFQRDLRWGIENGYLSRIKCLQAEISYDLSNVRTRMGDYSLDELEKAINEDRITDAIAQAYREKARGQTLIFGVSVAHCEEIAKRIPGAVCISAATKNRAEIIKAFTNREIPCIVNCGIFTEGTDIPLIETVMIARPTKSTTLYTQMVGRGTRLAEGKDYLTLIDCVGIADKHDLCTAPTLIGLDISNLKKRSQRLVQGDLFELEGIARDEYKHDPENIVRAYREINLWANTNNIDLQGLNITKTVSGELLVSVPGTTFKIPKADALGCVNGRPLSDVLKDLREHLETNFRQYKYIWDEKEAKRKWGYGKASEKQIRYIKSLAKSREVPNIINKYDAARLINALRGS